MMVDHICVMCCILCDMTITVICVYGCFVLHGVCALFFYRYNQFCDDVCMCVVMLLYMDLIIVYVDVYRVL